LGGENAGGQTGGDEGAEKMPRPGDYAESQEPERRSPTRRVSVFAFQRAGSETGAPIARFMVPMRAQEALEALQETPVCFHTLDYETAPEELQYLSRHS
jgi:hypothetical protein